MRFDLYDTKGKLRVIDCAMSVAEMRQFLSEFKTHCAEKGSEYEYNPFVNWLIKYKSTSFDQVSGEPHRVDM